MAYFKSNKVETRIANILKGTSDPISYIGDNGQLYLKYIDIAHAYSLREYIEVGNTAGPYINTRLFWSQSNEFEVKAQFMAEPENDTFVFGCWVSYLDTNIAYGDGWQLIIGGSGITHQQYDTNAHIYKAEQNSLLLDGSVLSGTPNWNNVPTNVPIAIFTDGARLTEKRIKNTRVYYAKIWDNGELTHYFVPAIRKSDDEIGMLDIITSTFYDNDGSGDFTISSTERTDIEGKPITSSFAKINDAWQNLIGTDIDAIQSGGSLQTTPIIIPVFNSTESGISTYTVIEDGLYLIEVSNSYSGTRSITLPSGRTPIVNEAISGDSRGTTIEIVELKSGDEITLSATVSQWVSFSKNISLLRNIEVLNVYDTDYADDTTLTYNSIPSTDDYYMTIGVCFGRQENNYYDGTVNTKIPSEQEDFSGTTTLGSIRLDKGKNFPELSYYGYDGGGAYLCVLNVRVQEEEEKDTSRLLFKDGTFYNQDILKVGLFKGTVEYGILKFTGLRAGFLIEEINLPQGITRWELCFKLRTTVRQNIQCGTCQPDLEGEDLDDVIGYGTNRITYNNNDTTPDIINYYRLTPRNSYSNSVFTGDATSGEHNMVFYIEEMTMNLYDGPQIIAS